MPCDMCIQLTHFWIIMRKINRGIPPLMRHAASGEKKSFTKIPERWVRGTWQNGFVDICHAVIPFHAFFGVFYQMIIERKYSLSLSIPPFTLTLNTKTTLWYTLFVMAHAVRFKLYFIYNIIHYTLSLLTASLS